ncbi:tRNA-dihydrouridine synthase [Demequina sp. SYSU T00192]|uniref:tRNA-dihydrouridine synthase n=1 Tax=Demequina litoralis TaxID=3051660 RepID=A0ABT8G5Q9_9MICO|nr:tRNA-dihydrouridine synthase [Demequina sp. SYSU T00192]MDN4474387.1 tRNA-dihydrouridine synthase [Demequina sp. SYSU T00192]
MTWFYDPRRTYDDNYAHGPFGALSSAPDGLSDPEDGASLLGLPVARPFGIPAGPLVNAAYVAAAFRHGFDVNVYKTVRTRAWPSHPFPNALAVHVDGDLGADRREPLLADDALDDATSISNSFGVPSRDPDAWQPDMAAAVRAAGAGQLLVGSFQGTHPPAGAADREAAYVADHVAAARLVVETGAPVLEMNLSCPNEGTGALLCFDAPQAARIAGAVKDAVGDVPLLLKLAYFADDAALATLVDATAGIVDGYAAVNTLPARLVDRDGRAALPGEGREIAGVCGDAIRWAGLDMTARLARLRERGGRRYAIVGVGGVLTAAHYRAYRAAGADAVMSATGAMIDPGLGAAVRRVSV